MYPSTCKPFPSKLSPGWRRAFSRLLLAAAVGVEGDGVDPVEIGKLFFVEALGGGVLGLIAGYIPFLTWGELRGGISIALPLSLPEVDYKSPILAATHAVALFTVIIHGLSLRALVERVVR